MKILFITILILFFRLLAPDSELTIVGEWQSEIDEKSIMAFTDENTFMRKYNDEITGTGTWEFVSECAGETAHAEDIGMLKISFDSELDQCYVVQGLNGALTLLALPQGRLLSFNRL